MFLSGPRTPGSSGEFLAALIYAGLGEPGSVVVSLKAGLNRDRPSKATAEHLFTVPRWIILTGDTLVSGAEGAAYSSQILCDSTWENGRFH